jgi:nitroimidazol reductase NimA-like FMN-containing flavoprotein (pyridoxamine 5'-phosphate oxidase superfamily)
MSTDVPPEVEDLLTGEPVVAHLATCADGKPHSAPLWYHYEDGQIEILTTGKKLENVRKNPRVAISMEYDTDGIPEWMVTVRGTATVVEDEEELEAATKRINRKYGVHDEAWPENRLVRIDVGSVSYRTY